MQVLTEFFLCNVGDDCDKFTIQITHNGFFVGLRGIVEYANSTTDWFDKCSRDTFSVLWIQDFVKQLGHPDNGRTHFYWTEFYDSVWDAENGDDDIFAAHVG